MPRERSTFPALTLLLSAAAVLVMACGLSSALQYDRAAVAAGEGWRLVTAHWTHWNFDHAAWDVVALLALGAVCERRDRRRFVATLAASIAAVGAGLWLLLPDMPTYRGLSGVDSALAGLLAASLLRESVAERRWSRAVIVVVVAGGFVVKTEIEMHAGSSLFVDSGAAGFVPVPLAHVLGAAAGVAVGACGARMGRHTAFPPGFATSVASLSHRQPQAD